MCAFNGAHGVPDFGVMHLRDRLLELVSSNGSSPTLLVGRSGSGKSVAAAQYARNAGRPCVWIEARGRSLAPGEVADLIVQSLSGDHSGIGAIGADSSLVDLVDAASRAIQSAGFEDGVTVVVDDLGPLSGSQSLDGIRRLHRALRKTSSKLVMTARGTDGWSPAALCECNLLGDGELAFTEEEATAVLRAVGLENGDMDASVLLGACGGHAAMFAVLARQAREYGLDSSVERTASLDAWFDRVLSSDVEEVDRAALVAASLLQVGTQRDLAILGVPRATVVLSRLTRVFPMLSVRKKEDGVVQFRVHDLVVGFVADRIAAGVLQVSQDLSGGAVRVLSQRQDYIRAVEVLSMFMTPTDCSDWLRQYGRELLGLGLYRQLARLIEHVPTQDFAGDPAMLMLWAELDSETGRWDDALSKCRLTRRVSEHLGNSEMSADSVRLSLACLRGARRLSEADALARTVLENPVLGTHTGLLAEAHFTLGHGRLIRGELLHVKEHLGTAQGLLKQTDDDRNLAGVIERTLCLLPALSGGEYTETLRMLSPLIDTPGQLLSARVTVRGNAAVALVETGRLSRCESLLDSVMRDAVSNGLDTYAGAYMPVQGCVLAGRGEANAGAELIRLGIAKSVAAGDEYEADQSRVYLSVVLRAAGDVEGALTEAERAFERLPHDDWFGFRRLAALEIAASLLSLGDLAAARNIVFDLIESGFCGNEYHALRASMVLAEADRIEGGVRDAAARIAAFRSHIGSENSNWQMAMYFRAFPGLLGVVAAAVGVSALPVHLLRMVLPEEAESALAASRGVLEKLEHDALGVRLLGPDGFARFSHRGGLPTCHVRMFGGLDVSVGGRVIRERDWKKRKARMLFAMLVIRRGQDVPRDQILEHLWPDMDEERARNNLYVAWSTMKSVLGGEAAAGEKSPYIGNTHGVCKSNGDTVRSDIDELEDALAAARQAEADRDLDAALQAYEQVASTYRGDLLPGDVYDDWFASIRTHYRSVYIDAMRQAATNLREGGDPHNALAFARRAIQADQLREDLYQLQMRCEIDACMRNSAIDTYFLCRQRLGEDLGLDPSAETRALYEEILAMEHTPRSYGV